MVATNKMSMEMVGILSILHVALVEPVKKIFMFMFNFMKKIAEHFAKFINHVLGRKSRFDALPMVEKLQHFVSTGAKMKNNETATCYFFGFEKGNSSEHRIVTVTDQPGIKASLRSYEG